MKRLTYEEVSPHAERFWSKVTIGPENECWPWTGALNHDGYGVFKVSHGRKHGVNYYASRVAYTLATGMPPIHTIDHVRERGCTLRHCMNPAHLQDVPQRVNSLRSDNPMARQARQTTCKNGHPLSGENVRIEAGGRRRCKICQTDRRRAWRHTHGNA